MNHLEHLFIRTLEDLEKHIKSHDDYELQKVAGILRKLLLDESPLVDLVNRNYRIKYSFHVTAPDKRPGKGIIFSCILDGIYPDTRAEIAASEHISRDKLLAYEVICIKGKPYTVRDIILHESNVMGAVHASKPKKEEDIHIYTLNIFFPIIGGHRVSLSQLKGIGKVVLKGLDPIRQAINAANPS